MNTIEQAIQAASKCLEGVGVDNSRLESEFLLAAFLQVPRAHLILHRNEELPKEKIKSLRAWVRERQKRKPLAYVTGEQPFRDLTMHVSKDVLIPRPETELLVEQAMRLLDGYDHSAVVADVGTGSGNIALSLSAHARVTRVYAIDRSSRALKIAKVNEGQLQFNAPIEWIRGSLLTPLIRRKIPLDLIVANLPYVRSSDMDALDPELHWEPRPALDGGPDGLRCIRPCVEQALNVLRPNGWLLLEIGFNQSQDVTALLQKHEAWTKIQVFRDLSGLPRIVQSRKKGL